MTVHVGMRAWRGVEASLIHEVAHLVAYPRERNRHHDAAFMLALTEVAEAWYGDASRYPWQSEYASVRRHAP